MAEPTALQPIRSQNGPTRDGPIVSVSFDPPPPTPPGFYDWPGMAGPLPQEFIDKIKWHRKQLPANFRFVPRQNGYSFLGNQHKGTETCTPEEQKDEKYCAVLERMDMVELTSEGMTESVMTGDGAVFTWGRGLGYKGGAMPDTFADFLARSDGARMSFLDHGVAMVDKQLRIVDADSNAVLVHLDAANFLSGSQPAQQKQGLLAIFIKVTRDFGPAASTAQWQVTKGKFLNGFKKNIQELIAAGWTKEAICYVVHCAMWGRFGGFDTFKKSGGSLAQILRTEVEFTRFFDVVEFPDKRGSYRVVPPISGGANPSLTMAHAMGHGIMLGIMQGYKTEAEMKSVVQPGDLVFNMMIRGKAAAPFGYYILRGSSTGSDVNNAYRVFIETHHHLAMADLIARLKKMSYADVKKRRDWYGEKDNETRKQFGPRIQVAMDAVLHRNEGETARWVLDSARYAGISETSCWDQFEILKQTIGLG